MPATSSVWIVRHFLPALSLEPGDALTHDGEHFTVHRRLALVPAEVRYAVACGALEPCDIPAMISPAPASSRQALGSSSAPLPSEALPDRRRSPQLTG